jgi:hypothetical protein
VNLREKTNLNKSNINTLIKLNYFITWGNNLKLLKIAEAFNNRYDKKHTEKTKVKRIAELKELESNLENNKLDIQTQLIAEYEVLDYAVSTYKVSENVGMAVDIDTENTPKIKFYMLATGEILELKIYRKNFFSTPSIEIPTVEPLIHKYDIIQLGKVIEREKNRKVNDEWIPTGEYEKYLQSFVMIKKYENEVKDGAEDNKQSGEADS